MIDSELLRAVSEILRRDFGSLKRPPGDAESRVCPAPRRQSETPIIILGPSAPGKEQGHEAEPPKN